MKIIYFANVKELIGKDSEFIKINKPLKIREIIEILTKKSEKHRRAFTVIPNVACSINCSFSDFNQIVNDSDEIAFFPPVTGG